MLHPAIIPRSIQEMFIGKDYRQFLLKSDLDEIRQSMEKKKGKDYRVIWYDSMCLIKSKGLFGWSSRGFTFEVIFDPTQHEQRKPEKGLRG